MKTTLLIAAFLSLGVSGSFACEFQRSAKADQSTVDPTVVASVAVPQSESVTTVESADQSVPPVEVPAK